MNNIKHYRKAAGITQAQIAERFGITSMAVSYWENPSPSNERVPDLAQSREIVAMINAAGVECTLDDVFPPKTVAA